VDNFPPFENTTGFLIEKDFPYSARVAAGRSSGAGVHGAMRASGGVHRHAVRLLQGAALMPGGFKACGFTDLQVCCTTVVYKVVTKTDAKVVYISRTCKFFFKQK
jgi:hypothetical protein